MEIAQKCNFERARAEPLAVSIFPLSFLWIEEQQMQKNSANISIKVKRKAKMKQGVKLSNSKSLGTGHTVVVVVQFIVKIVKRINKSYKNYIIRD